MGGGFQPIAEKLRKEGEQKGMQGGIKEGVQSYITGSSRSKNYFAEDVEQKNSTIKLAKISRVFTEIF